jgi:hypothetical protein
LAKTSSKLGTEVEAAALGSGLFEIVREPLQYMCFFRSKRTGAHFGIERVTLQHINLWVIPTVGITTVLSDEGISVGPVSHPYPHRDDPEKYGRIASLKSDIVLRDAELLCIPVRSSDQAVRVLSAV